MKTSQRYIESIRYMLQKIMATNKDKLALILERYSHEVYGEVRKITKENLSDKKLKELQSFFMDELSDRIIL